MSLFERELDAYEREVAARKGEIAGGEARREITGHLQALYAARLEAGESEEEARRGALASVGDLRRVARGEGADWRSVALLLAPGLVLLFRDVASEVMVLVGTGSALLTLLGPGAVLGIVSGLGHGSAHGQRRIRWRAGTLGWALFAGVALLLPQPVEDGYRSGILGTAFYGGAMFLREDVLAGGLIFAALAIPFLAHLLGAEFGRGTPPLGRALGRATEPSKELAAGRARGLAPLAFVFFSTLGMGGLAAFAAGGLLVFGAWNLSRIDLRAAAWGPGILGVLMFAANLVQYGGRMAPLDPGNTLLAAGGLFAASGLGQALVIGLRRTVLRGARERGRG